MAQIFPLPSIHVFPFPGGKEGQGDFFVGAARAMLPPSGRRPFLPFPLERKRESTKIAATEEEEEESPSLYFLLPLLKPASTIRTQNCSVNPDQVIKLVNFADQKKGTGMMPCQDIVESRPPLFSSHVVAVQGGISSL